MRTYHAPRLAIPVGPHDHARGDLEAPVTVVEYGDYQCPYCGRAYPIVKAVQNHFGPRLRFVFRNFPLSEIHPHAAQAAAAAEAAAERGKFWEMHDRLYEHQNRLAERDLVSYASELGIESQGFLERMQSAEMASRVQEDFMSGVRSGVNGTPTFFINGARYDGSWDYADLVSAIEASMQKGAVETMARR